MAGQENKDWWQRMLVGKTGMPLVLIAFCFSAGLGALAGVFDPKIEDSEQRQTYRAEVKTDLPMEHAGLAATLVSFVPDGSYPVKPVLKFAKKVGLYLNCQTVRILNDVQAITKKGNHFVLISKSDSHLTDVGPELPFGGDKEILIGKTVSFDLETTGNPAIANIDGITLHAHWNALGREVIHDDWQLQSLKATDTGAIQCQVACKHDAAGTVLSSLSELAMAPFASASPAQPQNEEDYSTSGNKALAGKGSFQ